MPAPILPKVSTGIDASNNAQQDCGGYGLVNQGDPRSAKSETVDFAPVIQDSLSTCPVFDQRPGLFEATRGAHADPVVVGQRVDGAGWRVAVLLHGAALLQLSPDQATALAGELAAYAELCRRGNAGGDARA